MKPTTDTPARAELSARAAAAFAGLHDYVQRQHYRGYEFDDYLESPIAKKLLANRLFLQRVWIQVGQKMPVNLRPLLGIPKLESSKARGFFAKGYLARSVAAGDAAWRRPAEECLQWLLAHPSPGYRGLSWGNAFDFASRGGFMPAGLPTVVWTAHMAEVFDHAFQVTGRKEYQTAVGRCAEFVFHSLPRHDDARGTLILYTPVTGEEALIHNSSLLGAATLLRAWRHAGGEEYRELARRAYQWSLSYINPDGSWFYGVGERWAWIDTFHTAYNIECLLTGHELGGEAMVPWSAVQASVDYWLANFFLPDGTPKYYHDRTYPLDIQGAAQAIETASRLADRFPRAREVADRVLAWTLTHMRKNNGAFRYQIRPYWKNNLESIHWGQATMLSALGIYLQHAAQKP